jgi:hypothetical protein
MLARLVGLKEQGHDVPGRGRGQPARPWGLGGSAARRAVPSATGAAEEQAVPALGAARDA